MTTKKKFQSRLEAILNPIVPEKEICETPNTYRQKTKTVDNVMLPYLEECKDDTKDRINKYNAYDFKLENLIEIGAISTLKECQLSRPILISDSNLTDKLINKMTDDEINEYIASQNKKTEPEPTNNE